MDQSNIGGAPGADSATEDVPVRPRDAEVVRGLPDVVRVFPNPSYWWQNASFALPLIVSVLSVAVGLAFGLAEALGFGLFGFVVTAIMVPVVMLTWRNTATSIVLTRSGAIALHEGRPVHSLDWSELRRIESVEYLGNQRYKLVHGEDERFMVIESEIVGSAALVDEAFALSGIPRQSATQVSAAQQSAPRESEQRPDGER